MRPTLKTFVVYSFFLVLKKLIYINYLKYAVLSSDPPEENQTTVYSIVVRFLKRLNPPQNRTTL